MNITPSEHKDVSEYALQNRHTHISYMHISCDICPDLCPDLCSVDTLDYNHAGEH